MKNIKRTLISAIALTVLAGCGISPNTGLGSTANSLTQARSLDLAVGGFNWDRSEKQKGWAPIHHLPAAQIPASVDNRQYCTPIADQGHLGSCTAFAMVKGLREYLQNKNHEQRVDLSPLFFYYEERKMQGSVDQDSGATLTDGMSVLSDEGVCPESDWSYDISKFAQTPPAKAYSDAGAWKIHGAQQIDGLSDIKQALAKGAPVVFGFRVYDTIRTAQDGVIPVPKAGDKLLGGHAVMICGYDDAKKQLIIRNSWGTSHGDKGYYYMPYDYVTPSLVHDVWTALN